MCVRTCMCACVFTVVFSLPEMMNKVEYIGMGKRALAPPWRRGTKRHPPRYAYLDGLDVLTAKFWASL